MDAGGLNVVLRTMLSVRFLTGALVLVLLWLNATVIAERRSVRTNHAASLSNAPRIGSVLKQHRFKTENGILLELPSPDFESTVIYLSGSDPISLGELAVLDVIGRSELEKHVKIAWINLGYDTSDPVIDHEGLSVDVVEGSNRVLRQLGLENPIQGTVIVTSGNRIEYEGRVQKAHLAHQVAAASGLDIDVNELLPDSGTPLKGVLRGRSVMVDLESITEPIVLLLYAGYCGMCGENELYQSLRESTDMAVFAVFPDLDADSGVRKLISTLNMDMDFHFLSLATSTLDLDAFLYADPGVLVVEDARVRYAAESTDSVAGILRDIQSLSKGSRQSQAEELVTRVPPSNRTEREWKHEEE